MSNKIDKRIVEMSFENEKFEKGIEKSKNSLKDFTKALEKTVKTDGFSGLDKSVGHLTDSFSAFREIGVGALRKIGEEAVNTGARVIKALAIEPVSQGFAELELKMNSTQTIMASTGESLATVNEYLDKLNEYSDKTIYSFSDMTQNIGKFTNAGVKLDLAVAAIQGVSNAAALAGANAQEASRAMYNFAQALSAGYVKLIDWKSIENANMATVEFKTQLLEAAVAAGTVKKEANGMYKVLTGNMSGKKMEQTISATKNFNESLAYQWMTTDVLTKTLADYADETTEIGKKAMEAATQVTTFSKLMDTLKESVGSGWAKTFEIIFGDFNEGKKLWTGINDALSELIDATSDARNALLAGGLSSGWKQFLDKGVSNSQDFIEELHKVASAYGVEIDKIIKDTGSMEEAVKQGWLTGNMLTEAVSNLASKIENLSIQELNNAGYTEKARKELLELREALLSGTISADEFAKKISGLSGRENIIQGLKNTFIGLLKIIKPISEAFDQIFPPLTAERFFRMTETFREFTKQLIISDTVANNIKRTFAGFFAVIDIGWQIMRFLSASVMEVIKVFLPFGGSILSTTATLGDFLVMINRAIKSSGIFQYGLLAVRIAATLLKNGIVNLVRVVLTFVDALWNSEDPLGMIKDFGVKAFGKLGEKIKMVIDWVGTKFITIFEKAKEVVGNVFGPKISAIFTNILSFLQSIGKAIVGFVTPGFKGLGDAIREIDFGKITKFVVGGVLLLFVAQITKFTKAATKFVGAGTDILKNLNKMIKGPKPNVLRDLAVAIGVLAGSIWLISRIPAEKLSKSLTALGISIAFFVAAYAGIQTINIIASRLTKENQFKSAFGLLGLAISLGAMASALKTISSIKKEDVWECVGVLTVITVLISAYQTATALISKIPGQSKMQNSLLNISLGFLAMVGVIKILKKVQLQEILSVAPMLTALTMVIFGIEGWLGVAARIGGGNKVSASILSVSLGLLSMIGLIKLVNAIDMGDIFEAGKILGGIGLIIGVIEILLGVAAKIGGGKKLQANILSVTVGLAALVGLVYLIDRNFTSEALKKSILALAELGGIIAGIQILTSVAAKISDRQKLAPILLSTTLTMAAMMGLVTLINSFTQDQLNKAMHYIGMMALIISGIQVLAAVSAKISGGNRLAASIGSMTLALVGIAGSIAILSMIDAPSLNAASNAMLFGAAALSTIILAIGAFTAIAPDSTMKLLGLAASLILFGAGLAAMSVPLLMLASIDFNNLVFGVVALTALLLAFSIMGTTLQTQLPSLLLLGPALLLFAAGLTALTIPIQTLANMNTNGLIQAGIAIAGLVAVIELLGFTGTAILPGLLSVSAGILAFGVSLIPVAAAVDLFAAAITLAGTGFKLGAEAIDILVEAFLKLMTTVQENRDTFVDDCIIMGRGIGEGIFAGIEGFFSGIGEKLKSIWNNIITSFKNFFGIHSPSTVMEGLAGNLVSGLINGIQNGIANVVNAIGELGSKIVKGIGDFVGGAIQKGKEFINGFANGVQKVATNAIDAVKNFGSNVGNAIANTASKAVEIGKDFVSGFANGVSKFANDAVEAAKNMASSAWTGIKNFLGIHSPSKLLEEIGRFFSEGFGNGIQSLKDWVGTKAEELGIDTSNLTLSGFTDTLTGGTGMLTEGINALLEKLTGETLPSAESFGKSLGLNSLSGFNQGLTEGLTEGLDSSKNRVKTEFEKFQEYIEEENYYGRMSVEEELKAYKEIQKKYKEGSEERKKIDREIFRLTKKIYESQIDYIEGVRDAQKKAAEERLELEEDYHTKVREAEKDANKKRIEAQEDYAKESRAINERLMSDIASKQEEYENAIKSRASSIASAYDLFSKPNKARKVAGEKLVDYLELQTDALKDWQDQLLALEKRGVTGALLEELQSMGPDKTGELKGLLALTDEQLNQYIKLFETKNEIARSRATYELQGLKADTEKAIQELINDADRELGELKRKYDERMLEIDAELNENLTELYNTFMESQQKINEEMDSKLTELQEKYSTAMRIINSLSTEEMAKLIEENKITLEELNSITAPELKELQEQYEVSTDKIINNFDKDLDQVPKIAKSDTEAAINAVTSLEPEWENAGSNAAKGFARGISSSSWYAVLEARAMAQKAIDAANSVLGIQSPSKVFFGIGAFVGQGFANGISDYAYLAEQSSGAMADSVITLVDEALHNIEELNDDFSPVITPIIDLSNVSKGASKINSLFDKSYNIGTTGRVQVAQLANTTPNDRLDKAIETIGRYMANNQPAQPPSIQFTQNNYSPKALSRLDIYRQTKNQISALKGLIGV